MLQKVTMPDVSPGVSLEFHDNARDHARMSLHRILPAHFICGWGHDRSDVHDLPAFIVILRFEWSPVEHLETYHVQMDRMRVVGKIKQAPDFYRVEHRTFRYRHAPMRVIQEHHHRIG